MTKTKLDIVIVGMGPRGLSVMERLLVRLTERTPQTPVRIWTFDPGEHGAGRIWRTDQPDWFRMNTVAGEVSMYSGGPDGGPARPGAGPSLHEWLAGHDDPRWAALGESDFAPRSVYGRYLRDVFDSLVAHQPPNVSVHSVHSSVDRVQRQGDRLRVCADGGRIAIVADKVILATGHPTNLPSTEEQRLLDYADARDSVRYVRGDSAASMDLTSIGAAEPVGILGLGLTFFDVTMALTEGRGGVFKAGPTDTMRYLPSGREPKILAGSRSGVPMLARGANQKPPRYRYHPTFATPDALRQARSRRRTQTGSTQLDFRQDVLPLLQLEVDLTYGVQLIRQRFGDIAAADFARRCRLLATGRAPEQARQTLDKLLADHGVADAPSIDLAQLARPFARMTFDDPADYHRSLLQLLRRDMADAQLGNMYGPLKAALDILRDIRSTVRAAADFGGLRPDSHRDDFLAWFNPINTMLSAGPPAIRIAQAIALIEAGVLRVVGPDMRIVPVADGDGFALHSNQVGGPAPVVTTLIDARIPRPSVRTDASPLTQQLLADRLISEFVNNDPTGDQSFATGAVAVTTAPFHVIDAAGEPNPNLYVIGIPTENQRWFTQIGNGRPGPMTGFHTDADAIACDVLGSVTSPVPAQRTSDHDANAGSTAEFHRV